MLVRGILFALLTGLLWSFVGVFFNAIAKWRLSVYNITLVTNLITAVLFLAVVSKLPALYRGQVEGPGWGFVLFMLVTGVINQSGSLFLQQSMRFGNSAVTWAIGQSALIVPFVALTLFYSERWTASGIAGTLAIVAGMALLSVKPGVASQNAPNPRRGIHLAFCAFILTGIAMVLTAATGHFAYHDPAGLRAPLSTAGGCAILLLGKKLAGDRGFVLNRRAWWLIGLLALENVVSLWTSFRAIDLLAAVDKSALYYPITIGTCIAGYALLSVLFFHEPFSRYMTYGTLAIVAGIAGYCAIEL